MAKTTQAQMRASKKYNENHKQQHRIYSYRSYVRKFIREMATEKDLDEIEQRVKDRRAELQQ